MTEAEEADALALAWCRRRKITVGYLVHFTGYSQDRVERLIKLGEALLELHVNDKKWNT